MEINVPFNWNSFFFFFVFVLGQPIERITILGCVLHLRRQTRWRLNRMVNTPKWWINARISCKRFRSMFKPTIYNLNPFRPIIINCVKIGLNIRHILKFSDHELNNEKKKTLNFEIIDSIETETHVNLYLTSNEKKNSLFFVRFLEFKSTQDNRESRYLWKTIIKMEIPPKSWMTFYVSLKHPNKWNK